MRGIRSTVTAVVLAGYTFLLAMSVGAAAPAGSAPVINEFSVSHTGTDNREYIEIYGAALTDYSAYSVLQIEGDGADAGIIDSVTVLGITDANGFWTTPFLTNAFENGTITLLLVQGFSGAQNTDLDATNDGVLDSAPWLAVVDSVGVTDGGASDFVYNTDTPTVVLIPNYDGLSTFAPGGASRVPDGTDTNTIADWKRNDFELVGIPGFVGTPIAGEALNTPNAPNQLIVPVLVVNEIDYDQVSTDTAEFVEIKNTGLVPADLSLVQLQFVNGSGGAIYDTIPLPPGSLAVGSYFVVCANAATVLNCNLDDTPNTDFIQNGAPDAVALFYSGNLMDTVSYEGTTTGFTEGTGAVSADSNSLAFIGLSRLPDGADTNNNNNDFSLRCITPGTANIADTTGCSGGTPPTPTVVKIHDIQGSGTAITGTGPFTIEGIVVGDYQRANTPPVVGGAQIQGFFVQEEDIDADANNLTSEGIFVFCSGCPVNVAVGDKVQVTGAASEFFDLSELTATSTAAVTVLSSGNSLPTPATLTLPAAIGPQPDVAAANAALKLYYEPYEGMLVRFADTLTVAEVFEMARFGQIVLAQGSRPRVFTDTSSPSVAGYTQSQIDFLARTIILDDDDNIQNSPIADDVEMYYPRPGLSTTNYFRAGDSITSLTGVMHWSFAGFSGTDAWRIRPVPEAFSYTFAPTNPRPAVVAPVGGNLKVASANVLNYFTTLDTTSSDSSGPCAPSGTQDCRGADNAAELQRQQDKIVASLCAINPDIVGVNEIENNATVSMETLKNALNAVVGCGPYSYVNTGTIGTDAIKVGLFYKPAVVAPVGSYAILDSTVNPVYIDTKNRPALAQTFQMLPAGDKITVVINHLKSKGSDCNDVGDPDLLDGQGNCPVTRRNAALAEVMWLASDPTGQGTDNILVIGDLNSYRHEETIGQFTNAGYVDVINAYLGAAAYSYLFDGQVGYLDHALASPALMSKITGAAEFHINADEIPLFDYNDDIKDVGEAPFEEEPDALPLYEPTFTRSSDHDPLVVGINLNTVLTGHITVIKDAQPDSEQDFTFTSDIPGFPMFQLDDDADTTLLNTATFEVTAGTYNIAETAAEHWDTLPVICSNGSPANAVVVGIGETVTCTFVNTLRTGTIRIAKQTLPDASPATFDFTGSYFAGVVALPDGVATPFSEPLVEGTLVTLTEAAQPGWRLVSVACNDIPVTPVGGSIQIAIVAYTDLTCVFTNEENATITVIKDAQPDSDQDFAFTSNLPGFPSFTLDDDADATLSNTAAFEVAPGTYTIAETPNAQWNTPPVTCSNGSPAGALVVGAGESVTCTFVNQKIITTGSITFKKVTGPAPFDVVGIDFQFYFDGIGFQLDTDEVAQDNPSSRTFDNVPAGSHVISETGLRPDFYLKQVVCVDGSSTILTLTNTQQGQETLQVSVPLSAGQNIVCTFTNEKRGSLLVRKFEDKNGNGARNHFEDWLRGWTFTLSQNGIQIGQPQTSDHDGNVAFTNLIPGVYQVCETLKPGWTNTTQGGTPCATVTVLPVQTANVLFGNRVMPNVDPIAVITGSSSVTLTCGVDRMAVTFDGSASTDANGDALSYEWKVDGDRAGNTASISPTLKAGTHLIELKVSDNRGGRDTEFLLVTVNRPTDCPPPGSITVVKVTAPDTSTRQDFRFRFNTSDFKLDTDERDRDEPSSKTFNNLQPGNHTISEMSLDISYYLKQVVCMDGSTTILTLTNTQPGQETLSVTVPVNAGQNIVCTFTNEKRGNLKVRAFEDRNGNGTRNHNESWLRGWTFTLLQNGVQIGQPQVSNHDGSVRFYNLIPGAYQVCEAPQNGWNQVGCVTVTVVADNQTTLYIPNTRGTSVIPQATTELTAMSAVQEEAAEAADICAAGDDLVDTDADGIPDACDSTPTGDTDNDGIDNALDTTPTGDTDNDGVDNALDVCAAGSDLVDTDADGTPDACDLTPTGDTDNDGIDNALDTTPTGDTDNDGIDNALDTTPTGDTDNDGVDNALDVCATGNDLIDTDADAVPDACDLTPTGDTDNDGIENALDTTPTGDTDNDGVDNAADVCAAGNDLVDTDGDGTSDACDLTPTGDPAPAGDTGSGG